MATGRWLEVAWIVSTSALMAGCAATPGVALLDGTLVLGEVRHLLTPAMVNADEIAPGEKWGNLAQSLRNVGYADAQIDGGRVIVVRDQIYWNNTLTGIKHSTLKPALLAEGMMVEPGNVVEITVGDKPPLVIRQVRARSLAEGGCYYGDVPVGTTVEALGALSMVGPRGSATLYCASIEREGWQRPRTYWHKLPGAAVAAPGAPTPTPPIAVSAESAPEPAAGAEGMATLLIYLRPRRAERPYWHDLPLWVDGEKAALLDQGTCEMVLLAPGDHVVVAGTGEKTLLRNYARRELALSVMAGEEVVLEYVVDNHALVESEGLFEMFQPDKWEPRIYHFTQRPALASDSCAIRHAPTVLRVARPPAAEKLP
jgi:hypothetical protein